MKALFSIGQIMHVFTEFAKKTDVQIIAILMYEGFEYVNKCKIGGNYTDRTGNLRSSIGFAVLKNGSIVHFQAEGGTSEGQEAASTYSHELAAQYTKGIYLVIFAGMHYALYVEGRGYSVISSFLPDADQFAKMLESHL